LQQHERTLEELDIRIAVVTFEQSAVARGYARESGLRWPILVDDTRTLYRDYGMLRGTRWNIWGPRTWWAYAKELVRGRMPSAAGLGSDTSQLGGDVLVDPTGIVRFLHVGSGPADRPSVNALLAAHPRDVRLVLVGGAPLYGDVALAALAPAAPGCDQLDVCCAAKFLCVAEAGGTAADKLGQTWADMTARLDTELARYDALDLSPWDFSPIAPLFTCP